MCHFPRAPPDTPITVVRVRIFRESISMRLQHLGFNATDPSALADFLVRFFNLRKTLHNDHIIMLEDDHGFVLALLHANGHPTASPDFHLGFYVGEDELHATHAALVRHGHAPTDIALRHDGLKFFVNAPGDVLLEVSVPPASDPE
jgi:hypothetical protein